MNKDAKKHANGENESRDKNGIGIKKGQICKK